MEKSTKEIEKNVSASFGYVKKDMLMLNDAISDIHDKIQHLSLNHAALLEEVQNLRPKNKLVKSKPKKKAKKAKAKKTVKPKTKTKKVSKKKTNSKKSPKKVIETKEIVY